jgi:hypothetical protein
LVIDQARDPAVHVRSGGMIALLPKHDDAPLVPPLVPPCPKRWQRVDCAPSERSPWMSRAALTADRRADV